MTPAELPGRLRRIADEVRDRAAIDAANAMAQTYQRSVVKSMGGPAPSPPGFPPARRTGTLARSVRPEPAVPAGAGKAKSSVAPHTVYARIQQLGGDIYPVRAKVLRWKATTYGPLRKGEKRTGYVFAMHVHLPKRPYMVMTQNRSLECRDAAKRAVQRVIEEALHG